MKVGIITFHFAHNCGAMLQCWALQEKIEQLGAEVQVINYEPKYHTEVYEIFKNPFKEKTILNFLRCIKLDSNFILNSRKKSRFDYFKKNFHLTTLFNRCEEAPIFSDIDLMICGSDQIWNTNLTNGTFDEAYFGRFEGYNGKCIGYAISVGELDVIKNKEKIKILTREMKELSFREENTADEMSAVLERTVSVVPDPTLLLDKSEYMRFVKESNVYGKYILLYGLQDSEALRKSVQYMSNKYRLKIINISPGKIEVKNTIRRDKYFGPIEFLNYIYNAEYIVTNSFHGTVFSIVFGRKLCVVPHTSRNDRMQNLLKQLEIEQLMYVDGNETMNCSYDIDEVNKKLRLMRKTGVEYLRNFVVE